MEKKILFFFLFLVQQVPSFKRHPKRVRCQHSCRPGLRTPSRMSNRIFLAAIGGVKGNAVSICRTSNVLAPSGEMYFKNCPSKSKLVCKVKDFTKPFTWPELIKWVKRSGLVKITWIVTLLEPPCSNSSAKVTPLLVLEWSSSVHHRRSGLLFRLNSSSTRLNVDPWLEAVMLRGWMRELS